MAITFEEARRTKPRREALRPTKRPAPWMFLTVSMLLFGCDSRQGAAPAALVDRPSDLPPNVLFVVVDDLGFSDLSAYGSEISTPNMDSLANEGAMLTNFYASATCSPTRSMLLTGVDNHRAGLGTMHGYQTANQEGQPGYAGHLNHEVTTLPELLKTAGYRTYMTGKWHLGATAESSPAARGFDRSFVLLGGGASAFANRMPLKGASKARYQEDGEAVERLPEDFYSTRFYTERLISYLEEGRDSGQPFFAYLAYTSPHWPLQAPQESIGRQKGKYDAGYDALREARLASLQRLGFTTPDVEPFPRLKDAVPWRDLSDGEKAYQARLMEIYAAMVDDVDRYFGRLLSYLRDTGQYDNTLILFMSDNGPEGNELTNLRDTVPDCCDNSFENLGKADSYVWLGADWAQAGNPPLRMFKAYLGEGGIRVPAFLHFPTRIAPGLRVGEVTHVVDAVPTVLEAAGVEHPQNGIFQGRKVAPVAGRSLLPVLTGEAERVHPPDQAFGFELFGRRAIRQGDWKALYVPRFDRRTARMPSVRLDAWQLYNLAEDPAETRDLAVEQPSKLEEMIALWEAYAEENGVILPDESRAY